MQVRLECFCKAPRELFLIRRPRNLHYYYYYYDSDFFRRVNVRNTETERPRPQIATAREEGEIDNGLNEILNEDENFLDELSNRFEDTGPRGPPGPKLL